uniref:polysaccharide deacetylase family protein n=1 Tax=Pontibacterium sp. TaxID=2036026 RepID=UPI00356717D9
LSPDEIQELASGGLIKIGSHTVSHPLLASMSTAVQRVEIEQSKADLEKTVGKPVETVPQIFVGQEHIGGFTEFEQYVGQQGL